MPSKSFSREATASFYETLAADLLGGAECCIVKTAVRTMRLEDQDVAGPTRDFVGYGRRLPKVVWPRGANVALSVIVNYEEGSEYSIPAGDGRNEGLAEIAYVMSGEHRDLNAESVYEFGSRAGVMRLLRLFDELELKVTFFASAVAVERNREVGEWIREAGHEPCAHGWRWIDQWTLERDEERRQIKATVESLRETCGERPTGWFSRYSASVSTRELLVEEGGFLYDSDAFSDDLPYFTEVNGNQHLILPYTLLYNDGRVRPAARFRGALRLLRNMQARARRAAARGPRRLPKDDVARAPPALGRAGCAYLGATRVHPVRPAARGCLARPTGVISRSGGSTTTTSSRASADQGTSRPVRRLRTHSATRPPHLRAIGSGDHRLGSGTRVSSKHPLRVPRNPRPLWGAKCLQKRLHPTPQRDSPKQRNLRFPAGSCNGAYRARTGDLRLAKPLWPAIAFSLMQRKRGGPYVLLATAETVDPLWAWTGNRGGCCDGFGPRPARGAPRLRMARRDGLVRARCGRVPQPGSK